MQLSDVKDDITLRTLFENDQWLTLLLETGYRKALSSLTVEDLIGIKRTLRNFYMLLRVKAEIDQFLEGLSCLGVLDQVRSHPMLMQPLLIPSEKCKLSKGNQSSMQGILITLQLEALGARYVLFVCICTNSVSE